MKLLDIVPNNVMDKILIHIKERTQQAEKSYPNNQGKEDAVTGSLFNSLKTDWNNCDGWKWKIDYQTSHQRNKSMFNEHDTGADGIISIDIECNGKTHTKSILFQAKKKGNIDYAELNKQIKKMDNALNGGNMVIIYSTDGFFAQTANEFNRGNKTKFNDYLKNNFFACRSGYLGSNKYISDQSHCLTINVKNE